jgi:hypothetical protein
MNSVFKKLLQTLIVASFTVSLASAYDLSKKTPISIVKGFGKYPYQYKLNPFSNEFDLILYGCLDESENVKLVKSADDYASLVPVQLTMSLPDNGIKMKKTYHGFYETYLSRATDSTLRTLEILPEEDYRKDFKDDFLMAEYQAGMPIKMVFANLDQFKAVKSYLANKFGYNQEAEKIDTEEAALQAVDSANTAAAPEAAASPETTAALEATAAIASEQAREVIETEAAIEANKFTIPEKKPLLLIEFANGQKLEQNDLDFLNTYFELADANDTTVQAFFENAESKISSLIIDSQDFPQVGKSFGEMFMEVIEKDFENGDAKKLTIKAARYIAYALSIGIAVKVVDKACETLCHEPLFKWFGFGKKPAKD